MGRIRVRRRAPDCRTSRVRPRPCTPCRRGSSTSSTRHCSGTGRRLTIGAAAVRRSPPAVDDQAAMHRRGRCRRRSGHRVRAGSHRRRMSSGRPCRRRIPAATASAIWVPDPKPDVGRNDLLDRHVVGAIACRARAASSRHGRGPARPRDLSRASRGRADRDAGLEAADRQTDAAEAAAQSTVEVQKAEMQSRRNCNGDASWAQGRGSTVLSGDFSATGFFETEYRNRLRHLALRWQSRTSCGTGCNKGGTP